MFLLGSDGLMATKGCKKAIGRWTRVSFFFWKFLMLLAVVLATKFGMWVMKLEKMQVITSFFLGLLMHCSKLDWKLEASEHVFLLERVANEVVKMILCFLDYLDSSSWTGVHSQSVVSLSLYGYWEDKDRFSLQKQNYTQNEVLHLNSFLE